MKIPPIKNQIPARLLVYKPIDPRTVNVVPIQNNMMLGRISIPLRRYSG